MDTSAGTGSPPVSPNTSAFPTFLEQDPFPSHNNGRPLSSAASDATSEFDAGPAYRVPSLTGPVGEPGLPPSRPLSGAASSTEHAQRTTPLRTSLPVPPSRRSAGASARRDANTTQAASTMSRSHVPSLTAAGFSKPMNPQRLQAQRGQNVRTSANVGGAEFEPVVEHRRRESDASLKTLHEAPPELSGIPTLPILAGETFFPTTLPAGGATSLGSKSSTTPLYAQQMQDRSRIGMAGLSSNASPLPLTPRSNRSSFRASLGLGSRRSSRKEERRSPGPGHEKLPSGPASPIAVADEKHAPVSSGSQSKRKAKLGRNYEYFAGNLIFFCSGIFMNTRAKPLNLITFILTALPVGLFFGFSAPWLWHHVSIAIPIVFAYLFFISTSSFLHASFSDPGVLPRNLHPHPPNPEEDRDPLAIGPPTTDWIMVKSFRTRSAAASAESGVPTATTTAMEVPTKYCKSCNIWRPPRAHHCRICDACTETQDHHCVWLNNCVGRRNYRYFFSYVASTALLAMALFAFSLIHVILYAHQNGISFLASFTGRTSERVAFALFVYSTVASLYPLSLTGYHLFLMSRGETTREYLNSHKFPPADRHRPFSQASMAGNWASVLLRPRNLSMMAFHARYREGNLHLGYIQSKSARRAEAKRENAGRKRRVESIRKRHSLGKEKSAHANGSASGRNTANGTTVGVTSEVEMKKLPPSRSNGARSNTSTPDPAGPGVSEAREMKSKKSLIDRTPR